MEKYISKCLDSLIIPSMDKLDVVVVNDGSKDRSSEIAHDYEKKFPESIRVLDKENGNYGSCINAALPTLKGKYVKILDADDTFDTKNFEEFVNILSDCDADLVLSDYETINEQGEITRVFKNLNIPPLKKIEEAYINKINHGFLAAMHAFTYKVSIFKGLNYHQSEGISYTDTEWIYYPIINCHSLFYIPLIVYKYLVGREGQTMERATWNKRLPQFIEIVKKMINFFHFNILNTDKITQEYFNNRLVNAVSSIYKTIILDNIEVEEFKKFDYIFYNSLPVLYKKANAEISITKFKFKYLQYWNKKNKNKNAFLLKLIRNLRKFR